MSDGKQASQDTHHIERTRKCPLTKTTSAIDKGDTTRPPTGRPVVYGTQGVISSGHYLTSMAGMRMLLNGGNAFDAVVAATFAAGVTEPLANYSLLAEGVFMMYDSRSGDLLSLSGQGNAPAKASVDFYKSRGFEEIPTGPGPDAPMSFTVPAIIAALTSMLERYGTKTLGESPCARNPSRGVRLPELRVHAATAGQPRHAPAVRPVPARRHEHLLRQRRCAAARLHACADESRRHAQADGGSGERMQRQPHRRHPRRTRRLLQGRHRQEHPPPTRGRSAASSTRTTSPTTKPSTPRPSSQPSWDTRLAATPLGRRASWRCKS